MTVVPFKGINAKSRLAPLLKDGEREVFAKCMLRDVVNELEHSNANQIVILVKSLEDGLDGLDLFINEKGLTEAVNEIFARSKEPLLIVMPDLPLIRKEQINEILNRKEDLVIVPGRRGGTNVIFSKKPKKFFVDYHGLSFLDHLKIAEEQKLSVHVFDSFFLSTDIDEVGDLMELLIHGTGSSVEYLKKIGVRIEVNDEKEVCVRRGVNSYE